MNVKPNIKRSRLGFWILKRLLGHKRHYTLIGDMEELYLSMCEEKGSLFAVVWYWGQFIRLIPIRFISLFYKRQNMFKNYIKTAIRVLKRQKVYSFINISGLATGMACSIIILLWV